MPGVNDYFCGSASNLGNALDKSICSPGAAVLIFVDRESDRLGRPVDASDVEKEHFWSTSPLATAEELLTK